jgi:choice-of-anchor C domain-containing protein
VKRQSVFGASLAVVASLAVAGSALAAGPITNGSFEGEPTNTVTLAAGSTAIPGWTVTGTDVDWVSSADLWVAQDGTKSVDLNGFGQGGITQTFATTFNNTYVVHFWLSGNPGTHDQYPNGAWSPVVKTLTLNGTTFSYDTGVGNTFADMKWRPESISFRATGTSSTIAFVSTTVGAFGPVLDNVTVTETPATGAQCKDGGWQTMVDASGHAFKNQGACVSFYATSGATPIGS